MNNLNKKESITKVIIENTLYPQRGLRFGSPGTAAWIKSEAKGDMPWSERHILLSLGSINSYKEKYGLDTALDNEKKALLDLFKELGLVFTIEIFGKNSMYTTGKRKIK